MYTAIFLWWISISFDCCVFRSAKDMKIKLRVSWKEKTREKSVFWKILQKFYYFHLVFISSSTTRKSSFTHSLFSLSSLPSADLNWIFFSFFVSLLFDVRVNHNQIELATYVSNMGISFYGFVRISRFFSNLFIYVFPYFL